MLLTPDRTIDRGCWISGDRVYAFLSSAANAITEVGFHGPQPPSVNSRVLVDPTGAIRLLLRDSAGQEELIAMNAIDWFAAGAAAPGPRGEEVVVEALANQLVIRFLSTERTPIV